MKIEPSEPANVGILPKPEEKYLGTSRVVQIRRRDYQTGLVTEAVVLKEGRRQIATKGGEPLPLSAVPIHSTESAKLELPMKTERIELPNAKSVLLLIDHILHLMSHEQREELVGNHLLPQDKWQLLDSQKGGPTDTFQRIDTYAVGVERTICLDSLHTGKRANVMDVISISVRPLAKSLTHMKPLAGQLAALDALKSQMLGALSFLGADTTGNRNSGS